MSSDLREMMGGLVRDKSFYCDLCMRPVGGEKVQKKNRKRFGGNLQRGGLTIISLYFIGSKDTAECSWSRGRWEAERVLKVAMGAAHGYNWTPACGSVAGAIAQFQGGSGDFAYGYDRYDGRKSPLLCSLLVGIVKLDLGFPGTQAVYSQEKGCVSLQGTFHFPLSAFGIPC